MVGAVTTLIVIVAVFLAYNANNGLPFVPVYRVSVEIPNAARLGNNNEIRIGGTRVGVVESIEPVVNEAQRADRADGLRRLRTLPSSPPIGARLNLKLDKTAEPLPAGLGLPRPLPLDLRPQVPGDRPRHRAGRARGLRLQRPERRRRRTPTSSAATSRPTPRPLRETIPEQAQDGCFQPQTEFDAIANTFDTKTRENARDEPPRLRQRVRRPRDVAERRDRGPQPAARRTSRPVSRVLADPSTRLRRFFGELADTARIVAPVSDQQAQLFTNAARSRSRRSRPTPRRSRRRSPRARRRCGRRSTRCRASGEFLAELAELSRRLRPGVQDLRLALPSPEQRGRGRHARCSAGRRDLNRDLRATLTELRQPDRPAGDQGSRSTRLDQTLDEAKPLLRWVVPAQTVCNYWNYWFTFLPAALRPRPGRLQLPPGAHERAARPARDPARPAHR